MGAALRAIGHVLGNILVAVGIVAIFFVVSYILLPLITGSDVR